MGNVRQLTPESDIAIRALWAETPMQSHRLWKEAVAHYRQAREAACVSGSSLACVQAHAKLAMGLREIGEHREALDIVHEGQDEVDRLLSRHSFDQTHVLEEVQAQLALEEIRCRSLRNDPTSKAYAEQLVRRWKSRERYQRPEIRYVLGYAYYALGVILIRFTETSELCSTPEECWKLAKSEFEALDTEIAFQKGSPLVMLEMARAVLRRREGESTTAMDILRGLYRAYQTEALMIPPSRLVLLRHNLATASIADPTQENLELAVELIDHNLDFAQRAEDESEWLQASEVRLKVYLGQLVALPDSQARAQLLQTEVEPLYEKSLLLVKKHGDADSAVKSELQRVMVDIYLTVGSREKAAAILKHLPVIWRDSVDRAPVDLVLTWVRYDLGGNPPDLERAVARLEDAAANLEAQEDCDALERVRRRLKEIRESVLPVEGDVHGGVVAGDYHDRRGGPTYITHIERAGGIAIGDGAQAAVPPVRDPGAATPVAGPLLPTLRARLQRLDDVALDALCMDYFPDVYDRFSRGMRWDEKVNLLLDHCRRHEDDMAKLVQVLHA